MNRRKRMLIRLGLAGGLFVLQAQADPILAPASTLAHCVVDSTVFDDVSACALSLGGTGSASLTLFPFVNLTAEAVSPPNDSVIHGSAASAILTYSFAVIGGNAGDIVPILIATNLSTTGTDNTHGIGFAELLVHTAAAGDSFKAVCSNGLCGTTESSFSGTLGTRARSGDTGNTVTLQVQVSTGDSLIVQSGSASADPFIFVDPSFSGASGYSIVVSEGVANSEIAAVPEPGTMTLVLPAMALLGTVLRFGGRVKSGVRN